MFLSNSSSSTPLPPLSSEKNDVTVHVFFLDALPCNNALFSVKLPASNSQSLCDSLQEPSNSEDEPDVPEPRTLGAQYLTRYNTWKKSVRGTRPALSCMR